VLQTTEGVASVTAQPLGDGLASYEVRAHHHKDLREVLSQRVGRNGWPLRRLDLKRKRLQDRWNEINNMDDFLLTAPTREPVSTGSTAVTPA
jgi:hypothetical protein